MIYVCVSSSVPVFETISFVFELVKDVVESAHTLFGGEDAPSKCMQGYLKAVLLVCL